MVILMAIKDAIEPKTDKIKEEIPKFNRHKNVHFNIPHGKDAKNQYKTLIRNIKVINPKSYGNIQEYENYSAFDAMHAYLVALLEYCEGVCEIYKTKDYIINDELAIEKSYTIDARTIKSALITEEEKELLSELIETIKTKLYQMSNHEDDCYH